MRGSVQGHALACTQKQWGAGIADVPDAKDAAMLPAQQRTIVLCVCQRCGVPGAKDTATAAHDSFCARVPDRSVAEFLEPRIPQLLRMIRERLCSGIVHASAFVNACACHAFAQRVQVSRNRPRWLLCVWVEGQETKVEGAQRETDLDQDDEE
jgi:hypothetical protein